METKELHVERPLDRYVPSATQSSHLKQAEAMAVNRCLRTLGYSKHPLEETSHPKRELNIFEFYFFPEAGKRGYYFPEENLGDMGWDDAVPATQRKLLDGTTASYRGHPVPEGGCYGDAGRQLTRGAKPPRKFEESGMTISRVADASPRGLLESYVSVIRQALSYQIRQDTRIKRVISEWSACMKSQGYSYKSPAEAVNDERWRQAGNDKTSRDEIATATADMDCKKRVRYLDIVVAVETAYENRYIKQHSGRMKEFLDLRESWDQNAKRVIR
ncbi:hypothetical protein ACFZAE_15215 [Streptomyces scabiei]|uniref:hypothetical protein n=1 Tax=Streptomyces scabiei TaxID=1930 RepID=UPI0036E1FC25